MCSEAPEQPNRSVTYRFETCRTSNAAVRFIVGFTNSIQNPDRSMRHPVVRLLQRLRATRYLRSVNWWTTYGTLRQAISRRCLIRPAEINKRDDGAEFVRVRVTI